MKVSKTEQASNSSYTGSLVEGASLPVQKNRRCLISIWSTWYCILVVVLHAYIIKNRVESIVALDSKLIGDNRRLNRDQQELPGRVSLLAVSGVFLLLFLLTSLKQVGNYANDGIKFGRDFFSEKLLHDHRKLDSSFSTSPQQVSILASVYRHFLPFNSLCHLISILLLLFSELAFPKICDKLKIDNNSTNLTTVNESRLGYSELVFEYRFEALSIILALISLFIRYGSVFWFTNKCLSLLITLIGFIASVEQVFQIYAFYYLYDKLEIIMLNSEPGIGPASYIPPLLIANKYVLIFLYFILSGLVYLSATPAYVFAFLKYKERFMIEEALFIKKRSLDLSALSTPEKVYPIQNETIMSTCCFNYCPHLIATVQLVLMCACKLPFCYDSIIYFNQDHDLGLMFVIICEIMHTIVLIFIWLLLTLKTDWTMHLQTAYSVCHWTYHLKAKEAEEKNVRGIVLPGSESIKQPPNGQMIAHYQNLPLVPTQPGSNPSRGNHIIFEDFKNKY